LTLEQILHILISTLREKTSFSVRDDTLLKRRFYTDS